MALFRCRQYPQLMIVDPRAPSRALVRFIDGYCQTHDAFTISELSKRPYIERVDGDADVESVKYHVEYRKCGKPSCKCAKGHLHGPYVYAYFREGGKTRRKYVGKA